MNKFNKFRLDVKHKYLNDININLSPSTSFRNRCEFGYSKNSFVMHDNRSKIYMKSFINAAPSIQNKMPLVLEYINNSELIKSKLFQVNFRANLFGDVMVSLLYHKTLSAEIKKKSEDMSKLLNIKVILRAKNEKYPHDDILFEDCITFKNIKTYQTDNCFYQPNKYLLSMMIDKGISYVNDPEDLLELYCGVGTFSLPLASIFKNILVTENNRDSIKCLTKAIQINEIKNINTARLSASEVVELFDGKIFKRMNNIAISSYNFSHILVDPPRSGLTSEVIELVSKFENIIYVSCNPDTYMRDVNLLKKHKVENIELFDQFPNTSHLEIVSMLSIN